MTDGIARVRLDDGTVVWARINQAHELGSGGGYQDTGAGDRVIAMAGGLSDVVGGVVRSLRAGLDPTGPVEVGVSFGIELTAQSGKIVSALADAGGRASVSVQLTWTEPGPADGAPDRAALPGARTDPGASAPGVV